MAIFDLDDIKLTQAYLLSEAEDIKRIFREGNRRSKKLMPPVALKNIEQLGSSPTTLASSKRWKFVDLPDELLTSCQPEIKVYKTYTNPDGEEYNYLLPMGRYLGLDEETGKQIIQGIVVKSAEFTRLGGNPAEVDTNIKFNLKLFGKDITSLFVKNQVHPLENYSAAARNEAQAQLAQAADFERAEADLNLASEIAADLAEGVSLPGEPIHYQSQVDDYNTLQDMSKEIAQVGPNGERKVAWIDLIKIDPGQPLNAEADNELVTSEYQARIRVEVGYAPVREKPDKFKGTDAEWLGWKKAIEDQREIFFLSLFKHQFEFRGRDGIELSIDFIATANAKNLSPSADLFSNPQQEFRLKAYQAAIKQKERELELANDIENKTDASEECIEDLSESIGYLEKFVAEINSKNKLRLLNQIYLNPTEDNNDVHFSRLFKRRFSVIENQSDDDDDGGIEGRQNRHTNVRYNIPNNLHGSVLLSSESQQQTLGLDVADQDFALDEDASESITSFTNSQYFIFLGDVMDAAIELLIATEDAQKRFTSFTIDSIMTRERDYNYDSIYHPPFITPAKEQAPQRQRIVDALTKHGFFVSGWVSYKKPNATEEEISIPIRDIPIALDIFRSWWINNFVKSGRKTLPLKDFITHLFRFVENKVFKDIPLDFGNSEDTIKTPRFIINPYHSNEVFASNILPSWQMGQEKSLFRQYVTDSQLKDSAAMAEDGFGYETTFIEQVDNNLLLNSDIARITFGVTNESILKKINFQREDIPGHAEARLFSDRTSVAANVALREKYNTSLELMGTTCFRPGSVVYIDPLPLDLGYADNSEDKSLARSLGLGGMYRVVNITSDIKFEANGATWNTKVNTKWETFGDGNTGTTSVTQPSNEDLGLCAEAEAQAQAQAQRLLDITVQHSARIAAEREAETQRLEAIADSELVSVSEAQDAGASASYRRRGERAARVRRMRDEGFVVDCFVPDTKVSMHDGTIKEIKDIIKGDIVLSYKDGDYVKGVVSHVAYLPQNGIRPVAKLGDLACSPTHPIYYNGQWKEIKDSDAPVSIVEEYVDAYYLLEIDSHDVYGSEHNFIADGYIMSGLGNNVTLNAAFQRQPKWNDENREDFLKKRMALGPLQSSEGI